MSEPPSRSTSGYPSNVEPELLLRGLPSCRFAAGFDSGDIVELGELGRKGFTPGYRC